jgi:predicted dehydrogenase
MFYNNSLFEIGIIGDNGMIESYFKTNEVIVNTANQKETTYTLKPRSNLGHGGTEFPALQAFADAVKKGKVYLPELKQARDSVLIAFAAEKAIKEGKVINIASL